MCATAGGEGSRTALAAHIVSVADRRKEVMLDLMRQPTTCGHAENGQACSRTSIPWRQIAAKSDPWLLRWHDRSVGVFVCLHRQLLAQRGPAPPAPNTHPKTRVRLGTLSWHSIASATKKSSSPCHNKWTAAAWPREVAQNHEHATQACRSGGSDPPEKWFQNHEPAAQLTEVWHCTVAHTHTHMPTAAHRLPRLRKGTRCARGGEAVCDGRVRLQASGGPR